MEAGEANQASDELARAELAKPMRNKTWDEMTPDQRMEAMREEVRYLRRTITVMEKEIGRLNKHQHSQDGSLMVPLKHREGERPYGYHYDPLK
jgi:hypothetical protein